MKTVVLGVTGGIAVYKACELVRLFVKGGYDVHVVMTAHATEFVTPLTFRTLSRNPVPAARRRVNKFSPNRSLCRGAAPRYRGEFRALSPASHDRRAPSCAGYCRPYDSTPSYNIRPLPR